MVETVRPTFRTDTGVLLVFSREHGVLFSPDGQTYYKVDILGASHKMDASGNHITGLTFTVPQLDDLRRRFVWQEEATLDGQPLQEVGDTNITDVVPLPIARKPEYLYRMPDGRFIYVSVDKYDKYVFGALKVYVGPGDHLHEVRVTGQIQRLRDGGTTTIPTAEGTLLSPSPFRNNTTGGWDGVIVERLDPEQFQITESDNSAQVIAKTA